MTNDDLERIYLGANYDQIKGLMRLMQGISAGTVIQQGLGNAGTYPVQRLLGNVPNVFDIIAKSEEVRRSTMLEF